MPNAAQSIVLATRNAGKIRELEAPLRTFGLSVLGLDAFPELPEVEETGETFEANALLKAKAAAEGSGLVAVADDSGLMVDALGGAPGVRSARYGADHTPAFPGESQDARNIRKLLDALAEMPEERRGARFVTVMAVCKPGGADPLIVRGEWEGRILAAPRGSGGFGYDPVFFDPVAGRAAAELTPEEKLARSHRGRALRELLRLWPAFWSGRAELLAE